MSQEFYFLINVVLGAVGALFPKWEYATPAYRMGTIGILICVGVWAHK